MTVLETNTIKAPLESLPSDMMKLVLQQLRPEDYGRLGRVSKSLRNLFSEVRLNQNFGINVDINHRNFGSLCFSLYLECILRLWSM
jgi:hypothetical protein